MHSYIDQSDRACGNLILQTLFFGEYILLWGFRRCFAANPRTLVGHLRPEKVSLSARRFLLGGRNGAQNSL